MNWHHKASKVLIAGQSGSGKSTRFIKLFLESPAKFKFAFDPDLEISRKCGLAPCLTVEDMMQKIEACLLRKTKTSLIVFDPSHLYPGNFKFALQFFCRWVLEVSRELTGKKVLAIDEIQKYTRTGSGGVPESLIEICDVGRREELDLLCVCNRGINEVNDDIRAQMTEIYCFKTTTEPAKKVLAGIGFSAADLLKVSDLKKGEFIFKKL